MRRLTESGMCGRGRPWIAIAALALFGLGGCDLGGRQQLSGDAGIDGGDTDTGSDPSTDSDDGGTDDDSSWRYQDAGAAWDDGSVSIDGPCDNDCAYLYNIVDEGGDESVGQSMFEIEPSGAGKVEARGVESFRYILWWSWPNYEIYRQRALSTFTLDSTTHDLISGEAVVYNRWGDVNRLKKYEFEYDQWTDEFSCTVDTDGRRWTRVYPAESPPLVMFNEREFPLEGFGSHSALFAYLIGERYDWTAGGPQQVSVFSPEAERIELLTIEEGDEDGTLIVSYPVDTARAPVSDEADFDPNNSEMKYMYDIPVWFDTRQPFHGQVFSGTPIELNLAEVPESAELSPPTPLGGYGSADLEVVSGDVTLSGVVDDPDAAGPHPVVVMLPGWDHVTRQGEVGAVHLFSQLADRLAAAGYLVARTDARGSGASEGELEHSTLAELVADAEATVTAVAALAEADGTEVYLLAAGLGAHVAAGVASGGNVTVAGLILLSPIGSDYHQHADEVYEHYLGNVGFHETYILTLETDLRHVMDDLADGVYEGDYFMGHDTSSWQSLFGEDLTDSPPALPPTLILCGSQDHMVPNLEATELAAALDGAAVDVTSTVLDGLSNAFTVGTAFGLWPEHGSAEAVDDAAVEALVQWLDDQTGGE